MPWVLRGKVEYAQAEDRNRDTLLLCIRASLAAAFAAHRTLLDHPDMLEQPPEAYQDWLSALVFRTCPRLRMDLRPRALDSMEVGELEEVYRRLVTGED